MFGWRVEFFVLGAIVAVMLDANTPFEAVRQRADCLASIRNGEYLFKKPEPSFEVELDLFRSTRLAFA
jgi:cytosine/creatinine deaminase